MAPVFQGSPVQFSFTGASNSASRTIPSAAAVVLSLSMFDFTGDTVTATIAGAAPTQSYTGTNGGDTGCYIGVWVGAASGSQTVAISGGDAGDSWACAIEGIDGIDTTTPFDGQTTDAVSPASIDIVTSSDGLAYGVVNVDNGAVTTTDTERFVEIGSLGVVTAGASAAGTGGTVSIDWASVPNFFVSIGVNFRAAGGSPPASGTLTYDIHATKDTA